MGSTKKELKLMHLLSEIKSDNMEKVSRAIKSLEIYGDSTVILPLSEILLSRIKKKNQEERLAGAAPSMRQVLKCQRASPK